jgi:hypothetical protein
MATTYAVDLLNPEQTLVKDSGVLSFTGTSPAIPATLNQVSPVGTIVSGTLPNTGAWVSGTAKVNPTTRDITVYVEIVGDATNNAASCVIALSPDNSTFTTVGTPSLAAAVNNTGAITQVVPVRLPNGWYLKLTLVRVTVAASIYA